MTRKKRAGIPAPAVARPIAPTAGAPPAYPTVHALFAATPSARTFIATRLVGMARHAAVAGITVTALGCQHHDASVPTSLTPVPAGRVAPPPAAPTPTPPLPPPPPTPGQLALHDGDPCPDHPGGTVVGTDAASKLPPHHRHHLHDVGGSHFMGGVMAGPDPDGLGL